MTGMKEGAGEDPFADETDETAATGNQSDEGTRRSIDHADEASGADARAGSERTMQIPYKFRRDGVQDGRDRVPLFLKAETKRAERDALREIEGRFDDDVSLTDLREALVKVGLRNLDDVEECLVEWGYGMTFEE
jgi:hypothetical protein